MKYYNSKLYIYSGKYIVICVPVKGIITCKVNYRGHTYISLLIALAKEDPTWPQLTSTYSTSIFKLKLAVKENSLQQVDMFYRLLNQYLRRSSALSKATNFPFIYIIMHVYLIVPPKFCKARPLPCSMKQMIT